MATRTFCDHCGLKIPAAIKFCFGRYAQHPEVQYIQAGANQPGLLGGLGNQQQHVYPPVLAVQTSKPAERYYPTIIVDLCEVCVPIWYERASNLTKHTKD